MSKTHMKINFPNNHPNYNTCMMHRESGRIYYLLDDDLHRLDGPAYIGPAEYDADYWDKNPIVEEYYVLDTEININLLFPNFLQWSMNDDRLRILD